VLAGALDENPDCLRADLQRYYGIDLDRAMAGAHTAAHVAALVACLPSDAALFRAGNPDAVWTLEATLLAVLHNDLAGLMWGLSDKRKRGARPKPIGPSWLTGRGSRKLPARVLTADELMAELSKPRR
jgi:hypothetical protein